MADRARAALAVAGAVALLASGPVAGAADGWARSAAGAWRAARPLPAPPVPPADVDAAYRLQRAFVESLLEGRDPAGFKAGLTSAAARSRLGATEPVAGVLLPQGWLASGTRVSLDGHPGLHLEVEVGYRFARRVRPDAPPVDLGALVDAIVPVIELPDVRFAAEGAPSFATLIALDTAARYVAVGPSLGRPGELDPDALSAALALDGEVVARGRGTDTMGGQRRALRWLVSRVLASGWTIEPGQVLITGTLTGMTRARPGRWCALYDGVERVCLKIVTSDS